MLSWEKIDEDAKNDEMWETYPAYSSFQMTYAAHPVITEVLSGYGRISSWLKYSNAVEEWFHLTKKELKRRGPATAAPLSGRAELFKERLDRDWLKQPETGVEYFLATMRPYFAKDNHAIFMFRFWQMLRCNRGQTDYQRWLIKYQIARIKAIDITSLRSGQNHADVVAEVNRFRQAEHDRLRAELRQAWIGAPTDLQAAVDAVAEPAATDAMWEAARETIWRRRNLC